MLASSDTSPDEEVELSLTEEVVRKALAELPDDHRTVLALRYGLADAA